MSTSELIPPPAALPRAPAPPSPAAASRRGAPGRRELILVALGGIPRAMFRPISRYRRGPPGPVVAGGAVAALQLSLGLTLGLQLSYLLAALAAIPAVVWWRRGGPRLVRSGVIATLAGATLFG